MNTTTQTNKRNILTYQKELTDKNYLLLYDEDLDISNDARKDFDNIYYSQLESDIKDVHKNRMRAREVFKYSRINDEIIFESADSIDLHNKNYEGTRTYKRISLSNNILCTYLSKTFLELVPLNDQKLDGYIGINLFRTFDTITETRHKDFVEYVLIYCLNLDGKGAITQLSADPDGKILLKEVSLKEGEIFIFKDAPFYHYTTPLIPNNKNSVRDVIIMTIGV